MIARRWYTVAPIVTFLLLTGAPSNAQDAGAQKSYEGVLTFEVRNIVQIQFYTYSVKNGRIRVEGADREDAAPIGIIDYLSRKVFVILPAPEQYIEIPFPQETAEGATHAAEQLVQRTDSTSTIQGFHCEEFLAASEDGTREIWATKELGTAGTFLTDISVKSLDPQPWQTAILALGYFPLRVIDRDADGDERGRFDITGARKKALSEMLFRVPADYEMVNKSALEPKQPPKRRRTP